MDFKNKNVLITGAASGVGKAFAKYFSNRGARLVLVDIDNENLNKLIETLNRGNEGHISFNKDTSSMDDRKSIYDDLKSKNIEIDILVNNVGIGYWSNLTETPWEKIESVIDVNIKGTTHMVWMFLPQMLKKNSGLIINLSSTGAFCGANKAAVYTGSKAYVTNFTEAIDMELSGTGVRTLTAHPGATDTNFWIANDTINSDYYHKIKKMSAEVTVEEFMAALEKGKTSIIAGRKNRAMVFIAKFIPRALLKKMAVKKYK